MPDLISLKDFLLFLFGGAAIKIVELLLKHRSGDKDREHSYFTSISEAETQFRKELREELESLREDQQKVLAEMEVLKKEIEKWKQKYYETLPLYQKEKLRSEALSREIDMIRRYVLGEDNEIQPVKADIEGVISIQEK